MNKPYIFEASKNKEFQSDEAIIVLPDIYMQTDYSKRTTEEFAQVFRQPVFLLDYFYLSTGKSNNFSENDREIVHGLLENYTGSDFISFLDRAIPEIKDAYPGLKSFSVVGFCFGGRLAYVAGGYPNVNKIFSFYGGQPNIENYIFGKSPIDYLISKKGDSKIVINSFFGTNDPSIPEEDRKKVAEKMQAAKMNYTSHEYEAGHAYFQEGRKNFNQPASSASWEVLKQVLGN